MTCTQSKRCIRLWVRQGQSFSFLGTVTVLYVESGDKCPPLESSQNHPISWQEAKWCSEWLVLHIEYKYTLDAGATF